MSWHRRLKDDFYLNCDIWDKLPLLIFCQINPLPFVCSFSYWAITILALFRCKYSILHQSQFWEPVFPATLFSFLAGQSVVRCLNSNIRTPILPIALILVFEKNSVMPKSHLWAYTTEPKRIYNPKFGNGVFGNVYLSAGQH